MPQELLELTLLMGKVSLEIPVQVRRAQKNVLFHL